ncbi:hypothetical protein [Thalassospira sp. MCCC 1A01428]|uniref:hypothetical protein n=1 Tax=Thalassospira sp. MCCC 1A01428 TaxID=1470575 RepID=UPI000A1D647F|nr:hypothetical protein [Thalassospira sp. MCCC 1A01428]OSQ33572.1 hypothetical protein THS27_26075 [Thalassospira sp. MCCC 1A01428]
MSRRPTRDTQNTTPGAGDFPNVTPNVQDLHNTSDIRFVMVEVGKMTTAVENLKEKVDKLDANDTKIQNGIALIKGGLFVAAVFFGFLGWVFSSQINSLRDTLLSMPNITQQQQPAQPDK